MSAASEVEFHFKMRSQEQEDSLNLQSVQISQQIVDLLLTEDLGVGGHFVPPHANDVGDPIVIGGHSAHRQVLPLEHAFHAGSLPSTRRVRRMAPVAIVVIDPAPRDLLRIESKFRIALAPLHVATSQHHDREQETNSKQFQIPNSDLPLEEKMNAKLLHLSVETRN